MVSDRRWLLHTPFCNLGRVALQLATAALHLLMMCGVMLALPLSKVDWIFTGQIPTNGLEQHGMQCVRQVGQCACFYTSPYYSLRPSLSLQLHF